MVLTGIASADCVVFPGGHIAPLGMPGTVAPVLRSLLHRLLP
jgi:hypothetical protein